MKVKIIRVADGHAVDATIALPYAGIVLPSLTDGWHFNFKSNTKKENLQTYVLVCDDTPKTIEGCLSFKMRDKIEPYMAYVEVAPHNKGDDKLYDRVAGCLIAFACRLSFTEGQGPYLGWLAFDVREEHKTDEEKLMKLYSNKYKALRWEETTTMLIPPAGGEKLIDEYLN
jgi:hypothetical protein